MKMRCGKHETSSKEACGVEWIIKLWEEISIEMVKNSKESCVLTLANDGSEDRIISCFKEWKNAKQAERYWKVRCPFSIMMYFTTFEIFP